MNQLTNFRRTTARVVSIFKDDMRICSSRVIFADVETKTGERVKVSWAEIPAMEEMRFFQWRKKAFDCFERAWKAEMGDEVILYQGNLEQGNFFDLEV